MLASGWIQKYYIILFSIYIIIIPSGYILKYKMNLENTD